MTKFCQASRWTGCCHCTYDGTNGPVLGVSEKVGGIEEGKKNDAEAKATTTQGRKVGGIKDKGR